MNHSVNKKVFSTLLSGSLILTAFAGCGKASEQSGKQDITTTPASSVFNEENTTPSSNSTEENEVSGNQTTVNTSQTKSAFTANLTSLLQVPENLPKAAASDFSMNSESGVGFSFDASTNTYKITSAGTYECSGNLYEGQILVDTEDADPVIINLNGCSIYNTTKSPLFILNADSVEISAKKETDNTVSDYRTVLYSSEKSSDNSDAQNTDSGAAAISASCDLTLKGNGSLSVLSVVNSGVCTKDELKVKNVKLSVSAARNALKGNDSIEIKSGEILLTAGEDGMKTSSTDLSKKGNLRGVIEISGGTVTVYSAEDALDAATDVVVSEEAVLNLTTGAYAAEALKKEGLNSAETLYISLPSSVNSLGYHYSALLTFSDGYSSFSDAILYGSPKQEQMPGGFDSKINSDGEDFPFDRGDGKAFDGSGFPEGVPSFDGSLPEDVPSFDGSLPEDVPSFDGSDTLKETPPVFDSTNENDTGIRGQKGQRPGKDFGNQGSDDGNGFGGGWNKDDFGGRGGFGGNENYYYTVSVPAGCTSVKLYAYSANQASSQTSDYTACSEVVSLSAENTSGSTITISSITDKTIACSGPTASTIASALELAFSSKGIKSGNTVQITGGTILISSTDDSIHANFDSILEATGANGLGNVTISGGSLTLTSKDDGIHADQDLTIDNGAVTVLSSYEGLEGNRIYLNDGTIHVNASDDAVNANSQGAYSALIEINGGTITAAVPGGDTDTFDSNGTLLISGGTIISQNGQTGNSMAGGNFDVGKTISVTGGTVIAVGGTGSVLSGASTNLKLSVAAGDYEIQDADGNAVLDTDKKTPLRFTIEKSYTGIMITSSLFETGKTYSVVQRTTGKTLYQFTK